MGSDLPVVTWREAMKAAGRSYLMRLLEETRGDVTAAARIAGVHRATLYNLMARFGVTVDRKALPKWVEPLGKR